MVLFIVNITKKKKNSKKLMKYYIIINPKPRKRETVGKMPKRNYRSK